MARTQRKGKTSAKPVTPAMAFRKFTTNARKALQSGVANARKLALGKANEAKQAAIAGAGEAREKTVEVVTHLEKVFEERVSKAVSRLGVPTSKDVRALSRQVSQLQASVEQLKRSRARA